MHRLTTLAEQLRPTAASGASTTELRGGIIGLDTSHSTAFAKALNATDKASSLHGCRIVAATKRGSPDIQSSVERIPGYTEDVQAVGVKMVETIAELITMCDVIFLETNDGRPRLAQALEVIDAGLPMFIDKPVAASLSDTIAIYAAAKAKGVPIFSSSSLRWAEGCAAARAGEFGQVLGCDAFSPCALEETQPDLFWYGIHGVEMLFTAMGSGCSTVARTSTDETDVCVGTWSDGRVGTFRGMRNVSAYGGYAYGNNSVNALGGAPGYEVMLVAILDFFRTHVPPVADEETFDIYAFMIAADESKALGGIPVTTKEVMETAKAVAQQVLDEHYGTDASPHV